MVLRKFVTVLAMTAALAGPAAAAVEYQYEDNVRDLMASARDLSAKDELEEAAIEYENVLAIDAVHRDAALAVFEVYLELGAVPAAEDLLGRMGRMGVDPGQQSALRTKLDGVKAHPPPKRKRVFTAAPPPLAPVTAAASKPAAGGGGGADLGDDILDEKPGPAPSAAPGAAPAAPKAAASPAPAPSPKGGKDDIDDIGL